MAKRKSEVVVDIVVSTLLNVWCDDDLVPAIEKIEGVASVGLKETWSSCRPVFLKDGCKPGARWSVFTDKRYNTDEIAAEIRALGEKHEPPACDLPASRYISRISEMRLDQYGWTAPSAMYRNDGRWYLNSAYFVYETRDEYATLKVHRGLNGYTVQIPTDTTTKWAREDSRHMTVPPLPVISIKEVRP